MGSAVGTSGVGCDSAGPVAVAVVPGYPPTSPVVQVAAVGVAPPPLPLALLTPLLLTPAGGHAVRVAVDPPPPPPPGLPLAVADGGGGLHPPPAARAHGSHCAR